MSTTQTATTSSAPTKHPVRWTRRILLGLVAGAVWGAIGFTLAGQQLGAPARVALAASPAIGVLIAILFCRFAEFPPAMRITLSLVSLYVGAGLFGLAAGVADALPTIPNRNSLDVVIQSVIGIWWGVTFTFWLPILWALAYGTHALLGRATQSTPS